jgi:hypothetical protein
MRERDFRSPAQHYAKLSKLTLKKKNKRFIPPKCRRRANGEVATVENTLDALEARLGFDSTYERNH